MPRLSAGTFAAGHRAINIRRTAGAGNTRNEVMLMVTLFASGGVLLLLLVAVVIVPYLVSSLRSETEL